ncbi:glucosidase, partial [Lichenibacterium ramalinae]
LIVQTLERFHTAYGDELKVECPTGTGVFMNLKQVSEELSRRLSSLFLPDTARRRPCHGEEYRYSVDPYWRELVLFYEHFHGETGRGLGASHQTGWTATVISCLERASQTAA